MSLHVMSREEVQVSGPSAALICADPDLHEHSSAYPLASVGEMARIAGVHSSTIQGWIDRGLIRPSPVGGLLSYRRDDLYKIMRAIRENTPAADEIDDGMAAVRPSGDGQSVDYSF